MTEIEQLNCLLSDTSADSGDTVTIYADKEKVLRRARLDGLIAKLDCDVQITSIFSQLSRKASG